MSTPTIEQRLKAAIERASKRLSAEAQSNSSGASGVAKAQKTKPGTSASKVNAREFLGHVAGINDGRHMPAILEEGERVLTPIQTREWDAKHPGARKSPTSAVGMPKIYDAGGEVSIGDVPLSSARDKQVIPRIESAENKGAGTTGQKIIHGLENYGKRAGASQLSNSGTSSDEPMLESPLMNQMTDDDIYRPTAIPRIGVFDEGGEVSEQDKNPLGKIPVQQDDTTLRNVDGSVRPVANTEPAPAQRDLEQDHIDMRREQINQKQDQAIANGNLIDQGKALIAHRQVDAHESRLPRIDMPDETSLPVSTRTVQGTSRQGFAGEAPALPKIEGATSPLGNAAPSMPQYVGPGKPVAPGELIPEKQLPTDEYKFKQQDLDKRIEAARDKSVDENATPEERASARTLADQLEYRKEQLNRPAATSLLGKIGRGFERAGEIAGSVTVPEIIQQIPGTQMNKAMRERGTLGKIATDVGEEKALAETEAAQNKQTKSPWKPAAGGQFTQYDSTGKPIRQLFTNEDTGEQQWRDLPVAGGLPRIQNTAAASPVAGAPQAAPAGAAPAAEGSYFGTKEAANRPIGDTGVKQAQEQVKSASLRVPKGYDVAQPSFSKDDTEATVKDKVKDHETAVNNAILADRSDKAAAARESAAETKERRAEERKDKNTPVYAENAEGQTILTNKLDAQLNKQAFQPVTPGDINKDRQATRQLNDVQLNVSRYRASVDALPGAISTEHMHFMERIVTDKDTSGYITKLLTIDPQADMAGQSEVVAAWNGLTPEERRVVQGYIRSKSSVIAYQKALTGIGRTNKETLDIEMSQLPHPAVGAGVADSLLDSFQENIDQASAGFPKLPGLKTPRQVREEAEGKGKGKSESVVPSEGAAKFHMKGAKGEIFSNNGTMWYDKQGHPLGE